MAQWRKPKQSNQKPPKKQKSPPILKAVAESPPILSPTIPTQPEIIPETPIQQIPLVETPPASSSESNIWNIGRKELGVIIGCGALGLIVGLITSAFQIAGIIDIGAAHLCIFFAWVLTVLAVFCSERLLSASNKRTLTVVLITAVITGVGFGFIDLWMVSKKAEMDKRAETEKIAAQSNSTPIQSNIAQRPYVTISSGRLNEPLNSNQKPVAMFQFKNTGQTPAHNVKVSHYAYFTNNEKVKKLADKGIMPNIPKPESPQSTGVLGTDVSGDFTTKEFVYTPAMKKCALLGECVYYVWGEILYEDSQGKKHFTKFCFKNEKVDSINVTFCNYGNEIDKEK